MSSRYWDNSDARKPKTALDKLIGVVMASAWITSVATVTYGVLMFTDILPEEMRLAALEQMIRPDQAEEDPADVVKIAGLDPESLAMMVMAAQTLGETKVGLAATDLMEEYDEEAFELMQQMELRSGNADYAALLSQLPDNVIDTEMTEEEAVAELGKHSAALAEMQAILNEAGNYDGPIDGMDETGDIDNVVGMMDTVVETAADETSGGKAADTAVLNETIETALVEAGYLEDPGTTVKAMTDRALRELLDEQRYTVPMLDTETTDLEKVKSYKELIVDPERMLSGETEESVRFIRNYMLPHTLLDDAIAFREAGETDRALNALRLVFLAFPEHPMTGDALLLLSDIQDSQGETEATRRSLMTFLTVHGGHPRIADGVVRYSDWQMVSGDGLPAACQWLVRVSAYPPAINANGLVRIQRAASQRGCYTPAAPAEIAARAVTGS